jgi:high affinity Mn2+ porin
MPWQRCAAIRAGREVSVNLEQQVTETVGLFARAGWADGNVEPWDNTDVDRTIEAGVSLNGKPWNRPDDTIGIAGVVNGISSAHAAYFNAGGLGIVIGDGQLPHRGLEQIVETYYSYTLSPSTKVSLDYQFVTNPAYNTDRGPVNVFGWAISLAILNVLVCDGIAIGPASGTVRQTTPAIRTTRI